MKQLRGRVLVIEDDETLRDTLGEVMTDEGHDVRVAGNGHEALDCLNGWEADVVILDLMMPLMDAYEFRIRQRDAGAATAARVLVLSAARDLAVAADRLEADAFLEKPFALGEIIQMVDRLLSREGPPMSPGATEPVTT